MPPVKHQKTLLVVARPLLFLAVAFLWSTGSLMS